MKSTNKRPRVKSLFASALLLSIMTPSAVLAADVRLAGQAVITDLNASGSLSADARAEQVQQNLDNALVAAKDRTPTSVNITYVKGLPVVTLGGYQVITVDAATAKGAGVTPAVLAQRWADALRNSLRDQAGVQSYVAHLSGDYASNAPAVASAPPANNVPPAGGANEYFGSQQPQQPQMGTYGASAQYNQPGGGFGAQTGYNPPPQYGGPPQYGAPPQGYRHGRVAYAPAGLVINAVLSTSISTQVARAGDLIQANVSNPISLGDSQIPAGSVLIGTVTDAKNGRYLGLAGRLGMQFNRLRTPDGIETPISAHLTGQIGSYEDKDGNGQIAGETWKRKAVQAGLRGGAGAGLGAALGTGVGAIAGGGRGAGRGAWSGAAIGGGVGVAQSVLLRKGRDVTIQSGTPIQVQLDAPVTVAGAGGAGQY